LLVLQQTQQYQISIFYNSVTRQRTAMVDASGPASTEEQAVVLQDLQFSYPGCNAFLKGIDLQLPKGSRTLLIGANGAGEARAVDWLPNPAAAVATAAAVRLH
jgi:ABC-type transport system involved in cytochrome bd biosynthesis fused ATPase/permease subunit